MEYGQALLIDSHGYFWRPVHFVVYRKYSDHRFIQRLACLCIHISDHIIPGKIAPVFQLAFFKQRVLCRIISRIRFVQTGSRYTSCLPSRRSDREFFRLRVPLKMRSRRVLQLRVLIYIYDLGILGEISVIDIKSQLQRQLLISGDPPDRICIFVLLVIFLTDGISQLLCRHGCFLFPAVLSVPCSPCSLTSCERQHCGGQQGGPCSVILSFHRLFPLIRLAYCPPCSLTLQDFIKHFSDTLSAPLLSHCQPPRTSTRRLSQTLRTMYLPICRCILPVC